MVIFSNQDVFNKFMTLLQFAFFATLYTISFITGKPLNIAGLLTFIAPILTHTSHLISNTINARTSVNAANQSASPAVVAAMKEVVSSGVVTNGNKNAQ